ncbi:hypothetical protein JHL22_06185 [Advenella sp. WQ 585]|uniref:Uncharacterized protein n=1 Tax=Advenella mandrilli TaxID=2800330 RepID=A0ABS1EB59_9BURK|nr:hypothetical protein [Advenella mandrilli]MBK1780804.1 hypothetical protein [Advenella mandrilli]
MSKYPCQQAVGNGMPKRIQYNPIRPFVNSKNTSIKVNPKTALASSAILTHGLFAGLLRVSDRKTGTWVRI